MALPYLTTEAIEHHADVTRAAAYAAGVDNRWPFDIESTVEFHFNYRLAFGVQLPSGVAGMLDANAQVLSVSAGVTHDGRRRFTVAHEVGHLVLHIPLLLAQSRQPTLFAMESGPYMDERAEWQADAFAASILMPKSVMLETFGGAAQDGDWVDPHAVAATFGVSLRAATIRLQSFHLLHERYLSDRLDL